MKEYEEFLSGIVSFDEAAQDPQVQARLDADPGLREAFEAQHRVVSLVSLKRYEQQSPDSVTRIRAGVLRTLRSEASAPATAAPAWWGGFKLAASFLVLALLVLPFLIKPSGDIQPVTAFTASGSDTELAGDSSPFEVPADAIMVASNTAPSTQFGPVEVAPVNFDLP